eukprot:1889765-Alexandrium_andersonii.AAC.1
MRISPIAYLRAETPTWTQHQKYTLAQRVRSLNCTDPRTASSVYPARPRLGGLGVIVRAESDCQNEKGP